MRFDFLDSFLDEQNNLYSHSYIELPQLDEELMYFVLLVGVEPTPILDENEQKKFLCLSAKIICGATATAHLHKLCIITRLTTPFFLAFSFFPRIYIYIFSLTILSLVTKHLI